jgi:hypothetical protein
MEYFGTNSFIMNILRASRPRKLLIAKYLRAGNKGG